MKLYNGADSILHAFICFIIAMVVSAILAHTSTSVAVCMAMGIVTAMCAGIGKEFGDSRAEGNAWSWIDIVWDMIGAVIGSCFAFVKYLL